MDIDKKEGWLSTPPLVKVPSVLCRQLFSNLTQLCCLPSYKQPRGRWYPDDGLLSAIVHPLALPHARSHLPKCWLVGRYAFSLSACFRNIPYKSVFRHKRPLMTSISVSNHATKLSLVVASARCRHSSSDGSRAVPSQGTTGSIRS